MQRLKREVHATRRVCGMQRFHIPIASRGNSESERERRKDTDGSRPALCWTQREIGARGGYTSLMGFVRHACGLQHYKARNKTSTESMGRDMDQEKAKPPVEKASAPLLIFVPRLKSNLNDRVRHGPSRAVLYLINGSMEGELFLYRSGASDRAPIKWKIPWLSKV